MALFGWTEVQFWRSTPQCFWTALAEYNRVFAAGSEHQKRREFAAFKKRIEEAEVKRQRQGSKGR